MGGAERGCRGKTGGNKAETGGAEEKNKERKREGWIEKWVVGCGVQRGEKKGEEKPEKLEGSGGKGGI